MSHLVKGADIPSTTRVTKSEPDLSKVDAKCYTTKVETATIGKSALLEFRTETLENKYSKISNSNHETIHIYCLRRNTSIN